MLRKLLFINTRENDTMPALYPFIDFLMLGILVFVAYKIIKLD
jgi:hypothetical protein